VAAAVAIATNSAFRLLLGPGLDRASFFWLYPGLPVLGACGNCKERRWSKLRMKEEPIEVEGRVQTVLAGTMFRVELDNKHLVLATICGQMRKRWVRLTVGDRVKLEMSPYDLNKGRITWRLG